jgi:hypothetical protein
MVSGTGDAVTNLARKNYMVNQQEIKELSDQSRILHQQIGKIVSLMCVIKTWSVFHHKSKALLSCPLQHICTHAKTINFLCKYMFANINTTSERLMCSVQENLIM